jgi:DNA (cytosine-5)-methyltransferase 1
MNERTFYEFFAGGGMARLGLGSDWRCLFANDYDPMKSAIYRDNWGQEDFVEGDINTISPNQLPGKADLAWASFPCQDLSLAGNAAGLGTFEQQTRSGSFWAFWRLMEELIAHKRGPRAIVLENVYGFLTSNGGRDFALVARCLSLSGYRFGAIVLDAVHFVPQSRPRVFLIAYCASMPVPTRLIAKERQASWHPPAMAQAVERLAEIDRAQWLWLDPPVARQAVDRLDVLIEDDNARLDWHTPSETDRLVSMMSMISQGRLDAMKRAGRRMIGTIYKRTRVESGKRIQRAELRTDGIAGCLRTPGGGSSRQIVIIVNGQEVKSRLLSAREAARLMGLPESFKIPQRYNDAYHLAGDGVVVPVVRFIAEQLLNPFFELNRPLRLRGAA